MENTEEYDVQLPARSVKDNCEGFIKEIQQQVEYKECETDPSQNAGVVCDGDESFFPKQMYGKEDSDAQMLTDKYGCLMKQDLTGAEICASNLEHVAMEEDHRKKGFSSQQISENDGCCSEFSGCTSEYINEKGRFTGQQNLKSEDCFVESHNYSEERDDEMKELTTCNKKQSKFFFYDTPHYEETGVWIPVSVPPMSESEHDEWNRCISSKGGYIPEGDMGWGQLFEEDKELTMWDVVIEMLVAAQGRVRAVVSGDICKIPLLASIPSHTIDQAWKEMAQTLIEANMGSIQEFLEAEPPKWLPDSAASACMLCGVRFHPIMCSRHHCRFCGGIFCSDCTRGRSLLPDKFRVTDPLRVCDVCCVRLESVQPYLMNQVSRAAQFPTHDLTDLSTLRSWMNFPWGQSMEYEIYKATNTIRGYSKVGFLKPEKSIPEAILRHAKGLAILTIAKVGVMVTYNIGTGLVIARREDGSWSPPSAISSIGVGWGAQAGGELTDLIIVLRTTDAVKTFSSNMHFSVGAGLGAAVGIFGRTAEADIRVGSGGCATCYAYSCSKGAYVGCSIEGRIFTTRTKENSRFYGNSSMSASDILLGSLPSPPASAILYRALADLYQKLEL